MTYRLTYDGADELIQLGLDEEKARSAPFLAVLFAASFAALTAATALLLLHGRRLPDFSLRSAFSARRLSLRGCVRRVPLSRDFIFAVCFAFRCAGALAAGADRPQEARPAAAQRRRAHHDARGENPGPLTLTHSAPAEAPLLLPSAAASRRSE